MSFLIVSHGRTATKWLAWVMNHSKNFTVPHEPLTHNWDSPFYGEVNSTLKYQLREIPAHKKAIINRDLKEVFVSFCNRRNDVDAMFYKLNEMKRENEMFYKYSKDIPVIDYAMMTSYPRYLEMVLLYFGIDDVPKVETLMNQRINLNPVVKYASFKDIPMILQSEFNKHQWRKLTPSL
jgi:hypothetical protein